MKHWHELEIFLVYHQKPNEHLRDVITIKIERYDLRTYSINR